MNSKCIILRPVHNRINTGFIQSLSKNIMAGSVSLKYSVRRGTRFAVMRFSFSTVNFNT